MTESFEGASKRLREYPTPGVVREILLESLPGVRTHEVLYAIAQGDLFWAAEKLRERIEEQCSGLPPGSKAFLVLLNPKRFGRQDKARAELILLMEQMLRVLDPPTAKQ